MCTSEISKLSLKDLVFTSDNTIDLRDCYVKTGIEDILAYIGSLNQNLKVRL